MKNKSMSLKIQERLQENANKSERILDDIYLHDDTNEENPCDVYWDKERNLFYVAPIYGMEVCGISVYKLTKPQNEINKEHRNEILEYRLDKVTADDEVSLGDIFMHGKFIKKVI
jgi:hypothetical protein